METHRETPTTPALRFLPFGLSNLRIGETIRQAGLLFSAQTGAMFVNLLVTLVLLKWMDSEEMGRLAFCLSVIVLAGLFFELGIFAAGARVLALARNSGAEGRALGALVLLTIMIGAALALFVAGTAPLIDAIFKTDVHGLLITASALAFVQPFQLLIELSCQGLNRIRQLAMFQLLMTGLYLIGLLALALTNHLNAKSALLAYLTGVGIASLVTLIFLRPKFQQSSHYIKLTLQEARSYGMNLYLARITATASVRLDNFIIKYFVPGFNQLGFYDRAQKLSNPVSSMSRAVAITRFRAFTNVEEIPRKILKWNAIVLIASSLALVVFGSLALKLFFHKYADSAPLLIPFALYNLFAGLFQPYNTFLSARGHSNYIRNIAILVTIASITGLLIAVPLFGIIGAAWAGAMTMLLDYLLHVYYYKKSRESGV
ncbi:MAG: oligosaccharide flippase family protein [Acidobacteriota bacterium]